VFGIGMQEMVIVGLLFLIIFGPSKLPAMARDLGRFVNEARRSVEEFKEDLVSEKEGGQELAEGQHGPVAGEGLEDDVEREEDEAIPQNASRTS
jgi:Tat protein translocase TatB subunit